MISAMSSIYLLHPSDGGAIDDDTIATPADPFTIRRDDLLSRWLDYQVIVAEINQLAVKHASGTIDFKLSPNQRVRNLRFRG